MWNWGDIGNRIDSNTKCAQSTNRRFTTGARPLDFNIKVLDTLFDSSPASDFRSYLSSERCRFTRTFEALST